MIEPHALERGVAGGGRILVRAPLAMGPLPHPAAGPGEDHGLVAQAGEVGAQDLPERLLGGAGRGPVVVGEVETRDAVVEGGAAGGALALVRRVMAEFVPQPAAGDLRPERPQRRWAMRSRRSSTVLGGPRRSSAVLDGAVGRAGRGSLIGAGDGQNPEPPGLARAFDRRRRKAASGPCRPGRRRPPRCRPPRCRPPRCRPPRRACAASGCTASKEPGWGRSRPRRRGSRRRGGRGRGRGRGHGCPGGAGRDGGGARGLVPGSLSIRRAAFAARRVRRPSPEGAACSIARCPMPVPGSGRPSPEAVSPAGADARPRAGRHDRPALPRARPAMPDGAGSPRPRPGIVAGREPRRGLAHSPA